MFMHNNNFSDYMIELQEKQAILILDLKDLGGDYVLLTYHKNTEIKDI